MTLNQKHVLILLLNSIEKLFKIEDHIRISSYKTLLAKGYERNWIQKVFMVEKVRCSLSWTYGVNGLSGENITGTFYEKIGKRQISQNLELKSDQEKR